MLNLTKIKRETFSKETAELVKNSNIYDQYLSIKYEHI
jgi:hypothetical protein